MEIRTKADLRLVGRAVRAGWDVNKEDVKAALMSVIALGDPELIIDAAKVLVVADSLDAKREETQRRKEEKEFEQRLRLLELARTVPAPELVSIASSNGIGCNAG